MAAFTKIQVIQSMIETGVVPVFNSNSEEQAKSVLKAVYDGGIKVFEFTNRGDCAQDVFTALSKYALKNLPGMILGVGSVVDPYTASLYLQFGANFIVSPMLNTGISTICNRRNIPYLPGCSSPTEIGLAQSSGCTLCKVFPGDVLRPAFVNALKGPLPWSMVMVTGMVELSRENLSSWFDAGVSCVGMGTNLFPKDSLEKGDWNEITERSHTAISIIREIKQHK